MKSTKKIKMEPLLKKIIFTVIFNFTLFSTLMIGLQNSTNKHKVNLLINETVGLPIGFILGVSFISGSLLGGLLNADFKNFKK